MQLKPEGTLLGLRAALTYSQGARYSEIRMASLQRGYEWEEKNWKALFEDSRRESTKEYPAGYTALRGPFIGVFILTELDQGEDPNGQRLPFHCEVVDGQQRVTTTFIFSAAIRDHLSQLTDELTILVSDPSAFHAPKLLEESMVAKNAAIMSIASIADLLEYEWSDKSRTPRLHTWNYLDDVVKAGIYSPGHYLRPNTMKVPPAKDPTSRFIKASLGLNNLIVEALGEIEIQVGNDWNNDPDSTTHVTLAKIDFLRNIYHTLVERMFVVKLATPNVRDAGEVFLSLNSKGKPLDTKDIVKAALLDLHSETSTDSKSFASKWSKLDKQVGDLNAFLRLAWMTRNGTKTTGKNVAVEITELLDKNPATAKDTAASLAKTFFDFGNFVEAMLNPKMPKNAITRNEFSVTRLVALHDVGSAYRYFLLPHTEAIKAGRTDIGTPDEVIRLLYTLAFTGKSVFDLPQAMEDFYFGLGAKIRNPQAGDDPFADLKNKTADAITKFVAGQQGNANALLILHALEEAWRECHGNPSIGWKEISDSVEHTAPQVSTTQWVTALNPSANPKFEYPKAVLQMGNLVHLNRKQNSRIQRKPWIDPASPTDPKKSKQAAFSNADYFTTRQCAHLPSWGMEQIDLRTNWLEEMISITYHPVGGVPCAIVSFAEWMQENASEN